MSAALGGTQSLHTNSALTRRLRLPTEFFIPDCPEHATYSAKRDRGNQGRRSALAGSYYVETLTQQLADEAWRLIEEVEEPGRYDHRRSRAGLPKLRIEEAAARAAGGGLTGARRSSWGSISIKLDQAKSLLMSWISTMRSCSRGSGRPAERRSATARDPAACTAALAALDPSGASSGAGNLLALAVECGAGAGDVWGRYRIGYGKSHLDGIRAEVQDVGRCLRRRHTRAMRAFAANPEARLPTFAETEGRRPQDAGRQDGSGWT